MTWAIFDERHNNAIAEIMLSPFERVVAVVGGTFLDDTLRRTISERFRNDKDITKKLLRPNGALGNMEPKIDMLYLLGAFEKPVRNAMYGICHIRNFFAHNLDASFDSKVKDMTKSMKLLTLHDGLTAYPHRIYDGETDLPIEPINDARDKFVVNLKLCLIYLMRDRTSHETWSNKPHTKAFRLRQMREWKKRERETPPEKVYLLPPSR